MKSQDHRPRWAGPTAVTPGLVDRGLVIGILGGMGPLATAETFRRIVAATPATCDQDHLHVVVDSDPRIPDRTQALLNGGADPLPRLQASAARLLTAGAEILCMPCNTAHAYHAALQAQLPVPLVDMVYETSAAAAAHGAHHGLLATEGTVGTRIYDRMFERLGATLAVPAAAEQHQLALAIACVKAGGPLDQAVALCEPAIRQLQEQGCSRVVVACTELSLLAEGLARLVPIVDAMQVMVERTVHWALTGLKPSLLTMPRQARRRDVV